MSSQKYCFRVAKIILCFGRALGITFGGIRISSNFNSDEISATKQEFVILFNKKWRLFGWLILVLYSSFCFYKFATGVIRLTGRESKGTIIDVIYLFGVAFYICHCCALYFVCQIYGPTLFAFLSRQKLSKKQFRSFLAAFFSPMGYIIWCNTWDLTECVLSPQCSIKKTIFRQILMMPFLLPWSLGFTFRTLVSLLAFWELKSMTFSLSSNSITMNNLNTSLTQICNQFIELKKTIGELDNTFALLNLTNFLMFAAFVLMETSVILNGNVLYGTMELLSSLVYLILECWVHGLPHKACKNLVSSFDSLIVQMTPSWITRKADSILSRGSVGFKLLGYNFDLSLLPSVSIGLLNRTNYFIKTFNDNKTILLFRYLYSFCLMQSW